MTQLTDSSDAPLAWGGQLTVSPDVAPCLCVSTHRPKPRLNHMHHIVPLAWGGPDDDDNLVAICPTTHANIHTLLRQYEKSGGVPPYEIRKRYSGYCRKLAYEGWKNRNAWRTG